MLQRQRAHNCEGARYRILDSQGENFDAIHCETNEDKHRQRACICKGASYLWEAAHLP